MNKIEVIAWTLQDAIDIEKAGAHRIEFVEDLERGGLTPDIDLIKQVVDAVNIPVRVMVRDTDESFVYDEETMNGHLGYIRQLTQIGVEGIVFGSLTTDGSIDYEQLQEVVLTKGNMKLAFHRAFDELDEAKALVEFEELSTYDVDTLLTSGTKTSALEGVDIIKKLVEKETIDILPGKSIGPENAKEILQKTGANWIHVGYSVRDEEGNISPEKIRYLLNEIESE